MNSIKGKNILHTKFSLILFLVFLGLVLASAAVAAVSAFSEREPVEVGGGERVNAAVRVGDKRWLGAYRKLLVCNGDYEVERTETFENTILAMESYGENVLVSFDDNTVKLFGPDLALLAESEPFNYRIVRLATDGDSVFAGGSVNAESTVIKLDSELRTVKRTPRSSYLFKGFWYDESLDSLLIYDQYGGAVRMSSELAVESEDSFRYETSSCTFDREHGVVYIGNSDGGLDRYRAEDNSRLGSSSVGDEIMNLHFDSELETLFYTTRYSNRVTAADSDGVEKFTFPAVNNVTFLSSDGENGTILFASAESGLRAADFSSVSGAGLRSTLTVCFSVVGGISALAAVYFGFACFGFRKIERFNAGTKAVLGKLYASKAVYLALFPTLFLIVVFCYYPAIQGLFLAFFRSVPGKPIEFVGFENFKTIFSTSYMTTGILNQLKFLVTDLLKALVPPVLFAEFIMAIKSGKMRYVTRVLLYLPGVIPGIAGLLIWTDGIFSFNGLANSVLGFFHIAPQNWLGQSGTALWTLAFFGFPWIGAYLIFYGSLMSIPASYYEAAKLEGCSWWKKIVRIDIPLILPQMKYIFVTCIIGTMQDFQRTYLTTGGAFDTETPMLGMYQNLLAGNMGESAAIGLILFIVLFSATLFNMRSKKDDV